MRAGHAAATWKGHGPEDRRALERYCGSILDRRLDQIRRGADVIAILAPLMGEKRVMGSKPHGWIRGALAWGVAREHLEFNVAEGTRAALPAARKGRSTSRRCPTPRWARHWNPSRRARRARRSRAEHRVPLSPAAMDTLERARSLYSPAGWCFPAPSRASRQMHATTLAHVVRRLSGDRCTVHGFGSSFRDWASEQTSVPHAVAEALANQVGSAVERSYPRLDLFADWPCMLNEDTELRPRRAPMRRKIRRQGGELVVCH